MTDPLSDAVHALRSTTSGKESGPGHYTRARVLAAIRQKQRRRVLNVAFGIPLAAVLIGSGAWASQQHLPQWVERISISLGLRSGKTLPTAPLLPPTRSAGSSRHTAKQAATTEMADPLPSQPVSPTVSTSVPTGTPGKSMRVPERLPKIYAGRTASSGAVESPASELELSLYEQAHRMHFVQRDPQAGLAAWNEYLRRVPQGRFAVEAHYNRAVCLVRLGRTEEAKAALSPFAKGIHAGYRQAEARALIEQLARPAP